MFKVYVLRSRFQERYYVGHCADMKIRLDKHNRGLVKSTRAFKPWKVVYLEEFNSRNAAYKRELEIKSYKGGNAFRKLIIENQWADSRAVKGDRL